jgi:hypothetical protein
MSSAGRTEAETAALPRRIWLYLGILLIVLIGGFFIGVQVLGVVLAALFPPMPPVPLQAVEQQVRVSSEGDSVWVFEVRASACDVAAFYESLGRCDWYHDCAQPVPTLMRAARCEGLLPFSVFRMRWEAVIASHATEPNATVLTLKRRILW